MEAFLLEAIFLEAFLLEAFFLEAFFLVGLFLDTPTKHPVARKYKNKNPTIFWGVAGSSM